MLTGWNCSIWTRSLLQVLFRLSLSQSPLPEPDIHSGPVGHVAARFESVSERAGYVADSAQSAQYMRLMSFSLLFHHPVPANKTFLVKSLHQFSLDKYFFQWRSRWSWRTTQSHRPSSTNHDASIGALPGHASHYHHP